MAYELSCRDAGMDCDFVIRTEQEDELMEMARKHLTDVHDTTMSRADVRDAMKTV